MIHDTISYLTENDMCYKMYYEKAVCLVKDIDNINLNDTNSAISLYNATRIIIDNENILKASLNLSKKKVSEYVDKVGINCILKSKLKGVEFYDLLDLLCDYKYNSLENSHAEFKILFSTSKMALYGALTNKNIFKKFESLLLEILLSDYSNTELIISAKLEHKTKLLLPKINLLSEEVTNLFYEYLKNKPNLNYIDLLVTGKKFFDDNLILDAIKIKKKCP